MAKATVARAEARFRQLCYLDLPGEALIPALLEDLHIIVPHYWARVFLIGENGRVANSYDEHPDAHLSAAIYWQEFHGRPGRELGGTFPDIIRTQVGVRDFEETLGPLKIDLNSFHRSDFYNLIYRTTQIDRFMRLIVREGGRGRPVGVVTMHRAFGDDRWTPEEKRRLGDLEPFLAYAMTTRGRGDAALADSGRNGLIVADRDGKVVWFSAQGGQLLFLATNERVAPDAALGRAVVLPPQVIKICRDLAGIFASQPTASAPTWHHRNAWGGFQFRAHWLDRSDPDGLIGITVNHKEPLSVRFVRRLAELPLNGRQAEVCLHMANGASNEAIAERLGISKHTAVAHGRWIYEKLGIHNRAELVSKLLAN